MGKKDINLLLSVNSSGAMATAKNSKQQGHFLEIKQGIAGSYFWRQELEVYNVV